MVSDYESLGLDRVIEGRCLSEYTVGSPQAVDFDLGWALFTYIAVFV